MPGTTRRDSNAFQASLAHPAACRVNLHGYDHGMRAAVLLMLVVSLSGCIAVLGYEPTPEELAAILRGEDPRADEFQPAARATTAPEPAPAATAQLDAPERGTVLRWRDSSTLVIEADGRAEVVALVGERALADHEAEQRALSSRMNLWTYGKAVRLTYPKRDASGGVIYRDGEGRLLARIE